jgi:oxygen-independent coproporphyrinogen III oxidase
LSNSLLFVAGLYLHIPFCQSRCAYCDFHSGVQPALMDDFVKALCREIVDRASYLKSESLTTLYFGGGTPSLLSLEQLSYIFNTIQTVWNISGCTEITLEANPDDLTEAKLRELVALPINRLSIGIQSFNDNELQLLRRRHTALQAKEAVKRAQRYFSNISVDLMYGLPLQTLSSWKHTILQALSLTIQHVSAYHLTYETGTLLERKRREGKITPIDEEISRKMYTLLVEKLHQNGIEQYEISNFALPGFHSRHNSSYWESISYLGVGPSAHSFDGRSRQWNIAHTARYIAGVKQGAPLFEKEELTDTDRYNELIMLSLRTTNGLSLATVAKAFGAKERWQLLQKAERYLAEGVMQQSGDRLRLTSQGLFVSDGIILELMRET